MMMQMALICASNVLVGSLICGANDLAVMPVRAMYRWRPFM